MSPSYDRYGRQPIGMGQRQRHRRRVSSGTPERGNSITPDARPKASMTVNAREVTQSEPRPSGAHPHELTVARVAEVHEAST